jgi:hypothetical protein
MCYIEEDPSCVTSSPSDIYQADSRCFFLSDHSHCNHVLPNYWHRPGRSHLLPHPLPKPNRHPEGQEPPRDTRYPTLWKPPTIREQPCQSSRAIGKEIRSSISSTTWKQGISLPADKSDNKLTENSGSYLRILSTPSGICGLRISRH